MHPSPDDVVERLRVARLDPVEVLGSGMEGVVVALGDDTMAKVWYSRTVAEVERLQAFGAALAAAQLPFATPEIHRVLHLDGLVASVQPHLRGEPLWDRPGESPPLDAVLLDAVSTVLTGLASVPPTAALAALPVLDSTPLDPAAPFGASLARVVQARAVGSAPALRHAVPDLERLAASLCTGLRALPDAPPGLIHGDLVPGNILMRDGAVAAVLDFGFLTCVGDPAFDAAVTASLVDMYGASARHTEASLDALLGHPVEVVALYRLSYALMTATWYSPSGSDGHFGWCVDQLRRPDLREAALP